MDKKLVGLVAIFFLVFGVFISLLFFNNQTNRTAIRASNATPSCDNSYIFASQVSAKISDSVTIIAYVRDESNNGLPNVSVTCSTSVGNLNQSTQVTTNIGSAQFTLQAQTPGIANISCSLATCSIPRSVTVNFTN